MTQCTKFSIQYSSSHSLLIYNISLQTSSISREKPQSTGLPSIFTTTRESSGSSNGSSSSNPYSPSSTTFIPIEKNSPIPPVFPTSPLSSSKMEREAHSPLPRVGSESFSYGQQSPKHSPHSPRRNSPSRYNRSPQGSISYIDRSPSPSPTAVSFDRSSRSPLPRSSTLLSPYDSSQMGRRSPRQDRSPSPLSFNHPMANTLPRNFGGFRQSGKWQ